MRKNSLAITANNFTRRYFLTLALSILVGVIYFVASYTLLKLPLHLTNSKDIEIFGNFFTRSAIFLLSINALVYGMYLSINKVMVISVLQKYFWGWNISKLKHVGLNFPFLYLVDISDYSLLRIYYNYIPLLVGIVGVTWSVYQFIQLF